MEVEDSGGVVLTAYHSHARPQPPSAEPRRAPRAAGHPGSRYPRRAGGSRGLRGLGVSSCSRGFRQSGRPPSLASCSRPGGREERACCPLRCPDWKREARGGSARGGWSPWLAAVSGGVVLLILLGDHRHMPHFCQTHLLKFWRIFKKHLK